MVEQILDTLSKQELIKIARESVESSPGSYDDLFVKYVFLLTMERLQQKGFVTKDVLDMIRHPDTDTKLKLMLYMWVISERNEPEYRELSVMEKTELLSIFEEYFVDQNQDFQFRRSVFQLVRNLMRKMWFHDRVEAKEPPNAKELVETFIKQHLEDNLSIITDPTENDDIVRHLGANLRHYQMYADAGILPKSQMTAALQTAVDNQDRSLECRLVIAKRLTDFWDVDLSEEVERLELEKQQLDNQEK